MIKVTVTKEIREPETFKLIDTGLTFCGLQIMLKAPLDFHPGMAEVLKNRYLKWQGYIV